MDLPLEPSEQILIDQRRHWVALAPTVVSAVALVVVAAVLGSLSGRELHLSTITIPAALPAAVAAVLVILAALILVGGWWVYRRNRLVLTDRHLFKVEQDGIFSSKISSLSLGRMQDVDGSRRGVLATLLGYGTVEVQTAGAQEEFVFILMATPVSLAHRMMEAHDRFIGGSTAAADDGVGGPVAPGPAPPAVPQPDAMPIPVAPVPPPPPPPAEPVPAPVLPPEPTLEFSPEPESESASEPPAEPPAPAPQITSVPTPPTGPQTLTEGQTAELE